MQHLFSRHGRAHSNHYRQTSVLLLLGFVFLTLAWSGMFHAFSVGVSLLDLGMLVVGLLKPRRFFSEGWLMTSLGVLTFLMFQHAIADSQVLTAHLLGGTRHRMDGPPQLYKRRGTDTGLLCCGGGSHRIPAGRTSHSAYCDSLCAYPLAPWVRPHCAWTVFSGCKWENIPGRAYEIECLSEM
jgi:hypothetical protein